MAFSEVHLRLSHHGGKCCGVKTIHGFYDRHPCDYEGELEKDATTAKKDISGADVNTDDRVFSPSAPEETVTNRLDRYIDFLKEHRPSGLIEVYLAEDQKDVWEKELLNRGFRSVVSFKNSNSENVVTLYHLILEDGNVRKEEG